MIFHEIKGEDSKKYNDHIVRLLIKCEKKSENEYPKGSLAGVLDKLDLLPNNTTYWKLKNRIWEFLDITDAPVKIRKKSIMTIYERKIDNAAEIEILRNKEGELILNALGLSLQTSKKRCEKILIKKILSSQIPDLLDDIQQHSLEFKTLKKTEQESIIKSRIGQGKFREELIKLWNSCSVTGVKDFTILNASHIKPWRNCTNEERLDPYNGLLLIPNLDALFDSGLITFSNSGEIILSTRIDTHDVKLLGVTKSLQLRNMYDELKKYLKYHRDNIFKADLT